MLTKLASLSADLNKSYRAKHLTQKNALFLPSVIMITDHKAVPHPEEVIAQLPPHSYVIFRDYDIKNRAEIAAYIQKICKKNNLLFGIANDENLARNLKADGLHLPEYRLSEIPRLKNEFFISVSCHSEASLKEAHFLFPDIAFLSPVFATSSHPESFNDSSLTIGAKKFDQICKGIKLPLYALGGLNEDNISEIKNAAGIATIRGFMK